ncbi:MAG: amidohydrolase family protein [Candidatus Aminicenantes bacterium]|nr:amidohydrolase family protein [Candidatus Aminicenantes bacterium]
MKVKAGRFTLCLFCLSLFVLGPTHAVAKAEKYDILIKDTTIIDGTGKAGFKGNVAIKGQKIVAVGKTEYDAEVIIDGSGFVTCPGFIDPHSHADMTIMKYPLAENLVMQGITTFLGGMCGISLAPRADDNYFGMKKEDAESFVDWASFGEYLAKVEEIGTSINFVPIVGHGALRNVVMGNDFRRKATAGEIEEMKKYVVEAMKSGAHGLSAGLDYFPGKFADLNEIVALAKVVREYGGMYFPHTRFTNFEWPTEDPEEVCFGRYLGSPENVWVGVYEGVIEAIETGKRAGIPVHMAHIGNLYLTPQPHPDFLEEATAKSTLWVIDNAIKEGVDFSYDVVAHANSICQNQKMIDAFYSDEVLGLSWVHQFSKEEFVERLKTREFRDRLRRVHDSCKLVFGWVHTKVDPYWMDCFTIVKCADTDYEGKILGAIARENQSDPLELMFDMLVKDPETVWIQHLDRRGSEIMNAVYLSHPAAYPCTDTFALPCKPVAGEKFMGFDLGMPPPIAYGLFPHYIHNYIKKLKLFSLEEGIKKATYLPAQRFGLENRGNLKPGAFADIVVFDYDSIKDNLDFANPAQAPSGIEYVIVNGTIVCKGHAHTQKKPGRVLRHNPPLH